MNEKDKTLVGVPFYEKEGQECLEVTLRNVNDCLNSLDVDASVLVHVNGPATCEGIKPNLSCNPSLYNAEVEIAPGNRLGQTRSIEDIIGIAAVRGLQRVFITDADIYRFPNSLNHMWQHENAAIVGARYRPYPIEMVEAEFGQLSYEEQLLYQIFDGDHSPEVRQVLNRHGLDRHEWVKGSLMLLNVDEVKNLHDGQSYASDSVINRVTAADRIKINPNAHFMHMGRVDMTDHIKARLRHFKAAGARGELETFLHREVTLPDEITMDKIAEEIRSTVENGDFCAMLYLARCAIRQKVNDICLNIACGKWDISILGEVNPISMNRVKTFHDASQAVSRFFVDIDWHDIKGVSSAPPSITQERLRTPFDVERHMQDQKLAQLAIASFAQPNMQTITAVRV